MFKGPTLQCGFNVHSDFKAASLHTKKTKNTVHTRMLLLIGPDCERSARWREREMMCVHILILAGSLLLLLLTN